MTATPTAQTLKAAYWERGETLVTLGQQYGVPPGMVHRWFKKLGVPTRSVKDAAQARASTVTADEQARMVALYAEGKSSTDIAQLLDRDSRLVRMHLEAAGVLRSRAEGVRLAVSRGKIKQHKFDETFFDTWTPEMAWVLGLIFGDGHVQARKGTSYAVQLACSLEVGEKVCALLKLSKKPRRVRAKDKITGELRELNCWMVEFYSRVVVERLRDYGLTGGSKAKTMQFPDVPAEMLPHFVRGLWDSDGSWSSRGFTATYTTASSVFLTQLRARLALVGLPTDPARERSVVRGSKTFRWWTLTVDSVWAPKLAEWLYCGVSTSMRCERKFGMAKMGG